MLIIISQIALMYAATVNISHTHTNNLYRFILSIAKIF